MSLTPGWRTVTKRTQDLFGRWGESRTALRSMLDGIIPVAVVDRYRDDDEGTIRGINAFTLGTVFEFPSITFGSSVNDWELLQVSALSVDLAGQPAPNFIGVHMFTPIDPYNPATTITPVGFFNSGLLTDRSFTFGTIQGIGGTNPLLPALIGPEIVSPARQVVASTLVPLSGQIMQGPFVEPVRVYRDVSLTFQWIGSIKAGFAVALFISILARERPKVSS